MHRIYREHFRICLLGCTSSVVQSTTRRLILYQVDRLLLLIHSVGHDMARPTIHAMRNRWNSGWRISANAGKPKVRFTPLNMMAMAHACFYQMAHRH